MTTVATETAKAWIAEGMKTPLPLWCSRAYDDAVRRKKWAPSEDDRRWLLARVSTLLDAPRFAIQPWVMFPNAAAE